MRVNQTLERLKAQQSAFGTMCNAASPLVVETLGHSGYDLSLIHI